MMVIRANMLARGNSGVRPLIAQTLIDMLNAGVTPVVPAKGSLGASGDLAPLAHIAVVLSRDGDAPDGGYSGKAWFGASCSTARRRCAGRASSGPCCWRRKGLPSPTASTSWPRAARCGTSTRRTCWPMRRSPQPSRSKRSPALSAAFDPDVQRASGQPGQQRVAANIRALTAGSRLVDSMPGRVQDAYSLRCTPQVLGPAVDAVAFIRERFTAAINAATDNPLIFPTAGRLFRALSRRELPRPGPGALARPAGIHDGRGGRHRRAAHLPPAHARAERRAAPPCSRPTAGWMAG